MKRRITLAAVGLVLVALGVAAGVGADRLVAVSRPSDCSVIGAYGATIQVQGDGAVDACRAMSSAGAKLLDAGTQDSSSLDCQYHLAGLTFTVRDGQGAYVIEPGFTVPPDPCSALEALGGH